MNKIVLCICARGPRLGKSTTTQNLIQNLNYSIKEHTIAKYIRTLLNDLAIKLGKDTTRYFEDYSQKDKSTTFGKEEFPFKTRDLLCDFSILLQKYYGDTLWGDLAVKHIEEYDEQIVIIDDLRRPSEYISLKNKYKDRLITVYLDKEDYKSDLASLSNSAQAFETKLVQEEMDIIFIYNKDWSNFPDLLKIIKEKIEKLS